MKESAKVFINQTFELSAHERAITAGQLLYSLDCPDSEMDEIWAEEAESRLDALAQGRISKVSAESALGANNHVMSIFLVTEK